MTCKLCDGSGMSPKRDGQFERCLCAVARAWLARQPLDRALNLLAALVAQFTDEHVRFVEEQRNGAKLPPGGCGLPGHVTANGDEGTNYCQTCFDATPAASGPPPIPVPQPRSFAGGEVEMECFRYAIRNSAPSPAASPAPEAREDDEDMRTLHDMRHPHEAEIAALRAELAAAQAVLTRFKRMAFLKDDLPDQQVFEHYMGVFDSYVHAAKEYEQKYKAESQRVAALEQAVRDSQPQISYVLRASGCPCGARPEDLQRFPHVTGCGFDQLERVLRPTPKEGA